MREIATIKDIAQKANVSPSTVSRALNGNSRISKETVTKIKKWLVKWNIILIMRLRI